VSVQQNKDNEQRELKPLSKDEAISSIRKFRYDFGLNGIRTDRTRIQNILSKSGLLSEEVDKGRREQEI
jgi:hypothetical protein